MPIALLERSVGFGVAIAGYNLSLMSSTTPAAGAAIARVRTLFQAQQAYAPQARQQSARERRAKLRRIADYLSDDRHSQALIEALQADLHKPAVETFTSEIGIVLTHIRHINRYLGRWMRPQRVPTPLPLLGTTSYIHYEPKGVCLVIAPWNYPLNLSLVPVIYALAAGCTVVLKPSEISQHCSAFLVRMMGELFDPQEVAVVEGDAEVAQALTALPFDHIFFTGSTQVGQKVMEAASQHLTSVTLELGGKSPAIVDETAHIVRTARHTVWAKYLNAGQTCIAPDYLIVHASVRDAFVEAYQQAIEAFFNPRDEGVAASADFGRMISDRHYEKVGSLLQDALDRGARILAGGQRDATSRFIAPTLIDQVDDSMQLMQEEIFGPIMPLLTYEDRREILEIVNRRPKPLTFYINSRQQEFIRYLIEHTSAGGTIVNDYLLGYANPFLPFGGVGKSGMGRSLGLHGFRAFSNERSIMHRHWGYLGFVHPPYTEQVNALMRKLFKWF